MSKSYRDEPRERDIARMWRILDKDVHIRRPVESGLGSKVLTSLYVMPSFTSFLKITLLSYPRTVATAATADAVRREG